jgi:hypothetical protein
MPNFEGHKLKRLTPAFWLSIVVILAALTWLIFPDINLEPLIVFIAAMTGIIPLVRSEFLPWFEHVKLRKKKFKFLSGSSKLNAVEFAFDDLCNGKGVKLNLTKQFFANYPKVACGYFEQSDISFQVNFHNGSSTRLEHCFSLGYETAEEYKAPLSSNRYFIAQADIDSDGVEEIVLGVLDDKSGLINVELKVYKYFPPYFEKDIARSKNLELIGTLKALGIVETPLIEIGQGFIKIPRNFRDFYYKWVFVDGKATDVGEY